MIERIKSHDKIRERFNAVVLENIQSGAKLFLTFLAGTDFYDAPASSNYHLDKIGGLALHSLNVWKAMDRLQAAYKISKKSAALVALFHDVCKINFYKKELKWRKPNEKWIQEEAWTIDDSFPYGHGEKSVAILQDHFSLTQEEKLAIRWHMGWSDPGVQFYFHSNSFRKAMEEPLVKALILADMEAAFFLDEA